MKFYPYPKGLENREIIRSSEGSERLKRMTKEEESEWSTEAFQLSLRQLIDMRIVPTYKQLEPMVNDKIRICDNLFMESLSKIKNKKM